jgi:hypothetical protein
MALLLLIKGLSIFSLPGLFWGGKGSVGSEVQAGLLIVSLPFLAAAG